MDKKSLAVIVLTLDEERHIRRCLESVKDITSQIIIVDCGSADGTLEIARTFGAEIELAKEIKSALHGVDDGVCGFYMKRRVYFMGRWIRHGGCYPIWLLRLFRNGAGRSEEREMDEHIVLGRGKTARLRNDFIDENLSDLRWWTDKHNGYSSREAEERTRNEKASRNTVVKGQAGRKRFIKNRFYAKLPLFLRSFAYFIFRYVFFGGFLDGKEGLIFHFLQGCWHQFLIDAKIFENRTKKD
ncbi:MAG: family 2 glycosyl transferase [Candidatus Jorgensenbacteria bacterium GW2011_GWA2_45_9]|uniref:Family 2 glycosyl transferase n=1 Tax=Candidatus Jorgensenbacteria bacterium GW2011_GWA2_45_9 TaxID=1618663 RepID=A0A0G1R1A4_9BACT|nr:MAG: family 2 glycosyl transferase [Candidatus Jorgensenbacteria bacterium GW2011_GWA2_45_9]